VIELSCAQSEKRVVEYQNTGGASYSKAQYHVLCVDPPKASEDIVWFTELMAARDEATKLRAAAEAEQQRRREEQLGVRRGQEGAAH
jgi:hypothetical protein